LSYWRSAKGEQEVDIVEEAPTGVQPFEVKYTRGTVRSKDLKGIASFCQQRGVARAWVLTREASDFGPLPLGHTVAMRVPAPLACLWLSSPAGSDADQP
jgi:hypothetical protein